MYTVRVEALNLTFKFKSFYSFFPIEVSYMTEQKVGFVLQKVNNGL